jgi:hypothetical protein
MATFLGGIGYNDCLHVDTDVDAIPDQLVGRELVTGDRLPVRLDVDALGLQGRVFLGPVEELPQYGSGRPRDSHLLARLERPNVSGPLERLWVDVFIHVLISLCFTGFLVQKSLSGYSGVLYMTSTKK